MNAMAGRNGMLPEQVWDGAPIPGKRLYPGKPTGSAMPLAWTHAEFVKLMLSRQQGTSFDCPRVVVQRYRGRRPLPKRSVWSARAPVGDCSAGRDLRVLLQVAATIRWRAERGGAWQSVATQPGLPGVHSAVLPTRALPPASRIELTWQGPDAGEPADPYVVVVRDRD